MKMSEIALGRELMFYWKGPDEHLRRRRVVVTKLNRASIVVQDIGDPDFKKRVAARELEKIDTQMDWVSQ